ncbi:MAG TPA: radical SAM protein [Alphaproteobacteria bacterium]|nr:radical SAM protein [Alphaproteobacteria bacterium]
MTVTTPQARDKALRRGKFVDPDVTADGARRAEVALSGLRTLWINTGTLCNLTCRNCYIESSPTNDRLAYITAAEAAAFFDEIAAGKLPTETIGFTGGEPFMNPDIMAMLADALGRGHRVLVLTNAMKPMAHKRAELLALKERFGTALQIRVSIDHHARAIHELERGPRSWAPTLEGVKWLSDNGFHFAVAGRTFMGEAEDAMRRGYARLFAKEAIALDARDPAQLVLLPEMDETLDVPEISEACWDILGAKPDDVMCAHERMVIKRKGAARPTVIPCTLLPYDERFEMGATLAEADGAVKLNHPHCARFCVLGGGSCSGGT